MGHDRGAISMKASELIKFLEFYIENMGDGAVMNNSVVVNELVSVEMSKGRIELTFKDPRGNIV